MKRDKNIGATEVKTKISVYGRLRSHTCVVLVCCFV